MGAKDTSSLTLTSSSAERTEEIGATLGAHLRSGDVVLLTGDLGAGKTQLTKGVASALGVKEPITSPTFNIVLEHETDSGVLLRHFDLYRLEDESELYDIDYFGLLEDGAISVVEWGDRFPDALPLDFLKLDFEWLDENLRAVHLSAEDSRGEQLLTILETAWGRFMRSFPEASDVG